MEERGSDDLRAVYSGRVWPPGETPGHPYRHTQALVLGSAKVLLDLLDRPAGYDLARDPGERDGRDVAAADAPLQAAMERVRQHAAESASARQQAPLDDRARQSLRGLGLRRLNPSQGLRREVRHPATPI